MKLRELGEFGLIDRIAERIRGNPAVITGIGDDAAVIRPTPGSVSLVTADMLLEGIHFDLSWSTPETLGRKSLAVNLSDIAAMGGQPRHCLLSLGIPQDLPLEFVDRFITGFLERAEEFGVTLVGGDTCASRHGLVVAVTLAGEQQADRVLTRNGARNGDLVVVTGTLGDSALGLNLLRTGERQGAPILAHLDPDPRVKEGAKLAESGAVSAMIDISDGLLADLGHILQLSGCGATIELAKLPLSAAVAAHIAETGPDGFLLPLAGGEDYELLFTIPPGRFTAAEEALAPLGTPLAIIGEISPEGLQVVGKDGKDFPVAARGYNHFPLTS